jgi:hypothetical protein
MKRLFIGATFTLAWLFLAAHLYFVHLLSRESPLPAPLTEPAIFYFAYGSNMNPNYLTYIRDVRSQWSEAGILRNYELGFGLAGIPGLEPSFANLTPVDGGTVYGVVHRLTSADLARIKGSERNIYGWRTVPVETLEGKTMQAWTLVAGADDSPLAIPSRRYLNIMRDAARRYGFPREQIKRLDSLRGAYQPVLSELVGTFIQSIVWLNARRTSESDAHPGEILAADEPL